MRNLTMCTLLVLLVGCGAQPTQPATTETPVNVAPASPAAPAQAAPAAAAQTATAAPGQPAPAVKPPHGFRLVRRNGQDYYCRSEATIGSKFKETLCYTPEQLQEIEQRADEVMDVIGKGCTGGACGSN